MPSLLLPNRRPIDGVSPRCDIVHLEGNDITSAQLAVDSQVEPLLALAEVFEIGADFRLRG